MTNKTSKEQWVCPNCGRRLHVPHQEHVCGHYELEAYLLNRDSLARDLIDWILETLKDREPLDVLPMKTMVGFQARSNFAFVRAMKKGAELSLILGRTIAHPALTKVERYSPTKSFFRFRLQRRDELDEGMAALLLEAFEYGS